MRQSVSRSSSRSLSCRQHLHLATTHLVHVLGREFKVKHVLVGHDALLRRALRNDNVSVLQAPAEEDLGGVLLVLERHLHDDGVGEAEAAREGCPRLIVSPPPAL